MSEVKTPPVDAALLLDGIVADTAPPGSIEFFDTKEGAPAGFHFQCPCGCRRVGGVRVAGPNAWQWNGNRDKPTITPSVLLYGTDRQPHWHGFLTDGVWLSC